jgi:anti-sigma B factor antagonist
MWTFAQHELMLRRFDKPNSLVPGLSAFSIMRREVDERTSAVLVEGDLDLSTAPRLKSMLLDALEGGHDRIVVDLSLVTFMDSTALGVLVGVNRRLDSSTRLAVVCTRPTVLQVFEFSGTDGAFAIHPTLEAALADTSGRAARAG